MPPSLWVYSKKQQLGFSKVVDYELQQVVLSRNWFFWKGISTLAHFNELHCVAIDSRFIVQKHFNDWQDELVLVTTGARRVVPYGPDRWAHLRSYSGLLVVLLSAPFE